MRTDWDKFDKEFENFDKEFDNHFKKGEKRMSSFSTMFKVVFVLAIIAIVARFALNGVTYANAKKQGKKFYTIEVVNFEDHQVFVTDSILSQSSNFIRFVDAFGREQSVSGQGIIVTGY
jgi:hypothetical protein